MQQFCFKEPNIGGVQFLFLLLLISVMYIAYI